LVASQQIATHSSSKRRNTSSPDIALTALATIQSRGHHLGATIPALLAQCATRRSAGAFCVPITLVANGRRRRRPSSVD